MVSQNPSQGSSGSTGSATEQVSETVQNVAGQAKQQASELKSSVTGQAKEKATSRASEQKDRAAQGLGSVATAFTQVSDQMREQNPTVAQAADTVAQKLQSFSENLSQQDISDMMRSVERYARQNSTAFIAGAFALGFLGARFLKSSSPDAQGGGRYQGAYGQYDYGYGTRPNYVTGYGTSYGTTGYGSPTAGRTDYGSSYGTTDTQSGTVSAYGLGVETGSSYGTATTGGGIVSGSTIEDIDETSERPPVTRTSYSPYGDTTETDTPTTER